MDTSYSSAGGTPSDTHTHGYGLRPTLQPKPCGATKTLHCPPGQFSPFVMTAHALFGTSNVLCGGAGANRLAWHCTLTPVRYLFLCGFGCCDVLLGPAPLTLPFACRMRLLTKRERHSEIVVWSPGSPRKSSYLPRNGSSVLPRSSGGGCIYRPISPPAHATGLIQALPDRVAPLVEMSWAKRYCKMDDWVG